MAALEKDYEEVGTDSQDAEDDGEGEYQMNVFLALFYSITSIQ